MQRFAATPGGRLCCDYGKHAGDRALDGVPRGSRVWVGVTLTCASHTPRCSRPSQDRTCGLRVRGRSGCGSTCAGP
eukprot:6525254-Prymnesium_polylepis.1